MYKKLIHKPNLKGYPIAGEICEVLVRQSYSGWYISTNRIVRKCKSRQEASQWLSSYMRRQDKRKVRR